MRVAHIITRMIVGGAQENTLFTCLGLQRDFGDEVLLITGPALGPEGSLMEQGRAGGVKIEVVDALRRAIWPWHEWQAYRGLIASLRAFKPDVVHTHSAKAGVLGRIAASRLGVPCVVHTVHGAAFYPGQGRAGQAAMAWAEWFAARHCHALISVADAMTDQMVAHRVAPREKFTTIYSGMDVQPLLESGQHRERVRRELGYTDEHVVVGKVARLFHLKGHEFLIPAAKAAVARQPQLRFLLVGDGLLRTELEQQIAAAGLKDHFRFTGLVPPERIPELVAAMDIVVHTSLREGLARVLPQGLIAGKPVVSYDVDGAREVVITGETGYLLPPKSIDELTDALVTLAGDPALRERLGRAGRERFTDQFRYERMTAEIRKVYERVLSKSKG
jgi:glycosyltransferase involved in cell wall biosynthesis